MHLALFDLDGILVDRQSAFNDAVANLCHAHDYDATIEQWLLTELTDRANPGDFARLRDAFGLTVPSAQLRQEYVDLMAVTATCRHEILESLTRLRAAAWTIGIVTRGPSDIQRAKLTAVGLVSLVDGVAVSGGMETRKPDRDLFQLAATRCGMSLTDGGWMIGDNLSAPTGKTRWSAQLTAAPNAASDDDEGIGADGILAAQVIGADDDTVVVSANDVTYAVDRTTSKVRWKKLAFRAVVMADGTVAGGIHSPSGDRLVGYTASSGKQRWTIRNASDPGATGPKLLTGTHANKVLVVDVVHGRQRAALEGGGCQYDGQSLILCTKDSYKPGITVFEARSFKKLWALPDNSGRAVPRVNEFWHGAVYGDLPDHGLDAKPVVLDGRTGKDREADPGAAPFEADQYGGVVRNENGVVFYGAVG
ncbi:HAD hydrolase-like protein [Streptomyces sp. NPDC048636]|uniref:HAD hydrolase-like protein n=1 Tax=Streptomyces sp. NPDC048636 TaxID=3155762 RepID=UPI00342EB9AC